MISLGLFSIHSTQGTQLVVGLNERLNQFETCKIILTAQFKNTDIEPFSVPVVLLDSEHRKAVINSRKNVRMNVNSPAFFTRGFQFKFREVICILDLILHLGREAYKPEQYDHEYYQRYDYMEDKYLIIIRHLVGFLSEDHSRVWGSTSLVDHRVFTWTVVKQEPSESESPDEVQRFQFHGLYFGLFYALRKMQIYEYIVYWVPFQASNEQQIFNWRALMQKFGARVRKREFWKPRSGINYSKLRRGISLPYDEMNLNRNPSKDFHKFIERLLIHDNFTLWLDFYIFTFVGGGQSDSWRQRFVADETDGFNFLTCITSDTFWSIAKLFWQPFQTPVWVGLLASLLSTGILIFMMKVLGQVGFSPMRLFMHILFNLMEIGVSPSSILGPKTGLKLVIATWLLIGIVLTNSYKGLIIAYLSVPWTPEQDYNYFLDLKNFKFYGRVFDEQHYWHNTCRNYTWNSTCEIKYTMSSLFGSYFSQAGSILHNRNNTVWDSFVGKIHAFSQNESNAVFQKLMTGDKIVVVGYNEEIDEISAELNAAFKGTRFFRGKEHLWAHNKNWMFNKISYGQPEAELVQLMASGIYQFWKYWLRDRKYLEFKLKADSTAPPEPLSLSSNVAFVFVVLIIGLTTSCFVFSTETSVYSFMQFDIPSRIKASWRSTFRGVRLRAILKALYCRVANNFRYIFTYILPFKWSRSKSRSNDKQKL